MADYYIAYRGVSLHSAVPGAHVLNVKVEPLPIAVGRIDRAAANGSILTRKRLTHRTIKVTVELPLDHRVGAYAASISRLRRWAESDVEAPLSLLDYPHKHLNCILTDVDDVTLAEWYKPIVLTFTAFDEPRFQSDRHTTAQVGEAFQVRGDAEARPIITHEITAEINDPVWQLDDTHAIGLIGTYREGSICMDLMRGYVTLNDSSLMGSLTLSSRFVGLLPGTHTIAGPPGGVITWHERWND